MFREICFFCLSFFLSFSVTEKEGRGWGGVRTESQKYPYVRNGIMQQSSIPARYSAGRRECWDCKSCACSVKPGDGSGSLKLSNRGNAKVTGLKFGSFMNYNLWLGRL